jgi:two-component system nitrate/nitrite response regulator NarL
MPKMIGSPSNGDVRRPIRVLVGEETPMACRLLSDTLKRSRLRLHSVQFACVTSKILQLAANDPIDIALISEDLQDGPNKGIQIVERLRRSAPNTRSVLLVRNLRSELTLDAFRNGAKGVFCREEPIESLWKCIAVVNSGQVWINSQQLEVILQALADTKPIRVTNTQGACLLTKREDEVGNLVAEGLTNKEVANRLGLSEHTVSNYLFRIYEKLGLSRRVEFVLCFRSRRQEDQGLSVAHDRANSILKLADNTHAS